MTMLYPTGSALDNSPIHLLCCNDTCSFTWTGAEHINQDIFECRTCGLLGSLCCCTECAEFVTKDTTASKWSEISEIFSLNFAGGNQHEYSRCILLFYVCQ